MKKIAYPAFIAAFFVLCALPVALMPAVDAGATRESTQQKPPPLIRDGALNEDFGSEAETWLSHHFAGRSRLVTLHARLVRDVFGTSAEAQVILGRDGWLFYEPTLEDFLGTAPYSDRELYAVAAVQRLMQEYVEGQGGRYATTVAPNKNSLYGEYMPAFTVPARAQSGLTALPDAMQAQGVHYVDLYGLLAAAREQGQLYHKRDTHWNNRGARLAYNALLDALDWPHDRFDDAAWTVQKVWQGDLDDLLLPAGSAPDEQVVYDIPFAQKFVYHGSANVELSRVVTYIDGGAQGDLLMFRDSFGNALIPFISTAFADATYLKATPYDLTVMQPGQTVITEIVERNLRVLLEAAPVLPAPARTLTVDRMVESTASTRCVEEDEDWLHVWGTLDPALVADDARVYLAVEAGGAVAYYEAFPCDEGTDAAGYGYSARLPLDAVPAGAFFRPVVQNGGECVAVSIKSVP